MPIRTMSALESRLSMATLNCSDLAVFPLYGSTIFHPIALQLKSPHETRCSSIVTCKPVS